MTITKEHELPPTKARVLKKATRLEWLTIVYLLSAIVFIYLTLGSSQAMKIAWLEDMLSLIPPIVFLITTRVRTRSPSQRFPYGYHRAVSIGYLCASLALFLMGAFLLLDSSMKLLSAEHPTIGTVRLFGHTIWLGWLMLPALAWSALPAAILGRIKMPLARQLHDKILLADAKMNKADWLTAAAAMAGVIGIAYGLWWADAVAAMVISFDILYDGVENLKIVVTDLMDRAPVQVGEESLDPLRTRAERALEDLPWVREAQVRLREEGHVYFGEAFVVPRTEDGLVRKIEEAVEGLHALDWRLHDIVITPVARLDPVQAS